VTVTNSGTAAGRAWTVGWTYPAGTTVASLWNGQLSSSGAAVTVRNAGHNGSLAPGATAAFGFVGSGAAATPGALTCTLT
jgi:cellulase/cellobiase CelA1